MKNPHKYFRIFLLIILIALFAIGISSCGTLNKSIHREKKDSTSVVNNILTVDTHTQESLNSIDTKTITEKSDLVISGGKDSNDVSVSLKNLKDTSYWVGKVKITEHFDKNRGVLVIHSAYQCPDVHGFVDKTTIEKNETKKNDSGDIKEKDKFESKVEVKSKEKEKEVKRTSSYAWWLLFYLIGVATPFIIKYCYRSLKKVPYFSWLP